MTLTELAMPPFEARAAFQEYRWALKQRANAEDRALMNAYRALARRRRVIDLIGSMQAAGVDEHDRPRLAIVRADAAWVECRTQRDGGAEFAIPGSYRVNARPDTRRRLPPGTFPVGVGIWGRARVPLIPPRYRPAHALRNYFLLWEAEWVSVPKDPILLRDLGKNLYAVLAQWDLTPLEQAVLRTR